MGILVDFKTKKQIKPFTEPTQIKTEKIVFPSVRCPICEEGLLYSPERGWYCPYCNNKH